MRHIYLLVICLFSSIQGYAHNITDNERNDAINCLNKACILAQNIKNEDVRSSALTELEACKKCFQEDQSKNFAHTNEKVTTLYENLDEILAECTQENLRKQIASCVGEMVEITQL